MKRLVLLFLTTLLCLCMFACSGKNNEVELTTENYETYLNVSTMSISVGKIG